MPRFALPDAPAGLAGPVKVWSASVVIPTYQPLPADKNPMFLERRVYQGSSGAVYPLPFTDRIADAPIPRAWQAVHLENDFLRLMILPEIGGRIHVALDKTNGYDFIYRQNVIKPALVGLAGPWISGGIEFNWPQHHRPSTFMPVDVSIESHPDGSRTVWLSEHDPMARMKGMHGVCLHPRRALIELKVRLYNRTPFVQTFLWWANVATRVHEAYQSFFPPDVTCIADHAKRAMSAFPLCTGRYYGINYARRARSGLRPAERPRCFVPPVLSGDPSGPRYAPNDLSWYANIPVPTSYMALGSMYDFFGGYDHARQAGIVHIADHHIAPGKKQWTWGNHEFGYAWDRNLTDDDGPYIELMAGVFTDNQPDFSFLRPGETKTFSQYWYPIQQIGAPLQANRDAAVSLFVEGRTLLVGVSVTVPFPAARLILAAGAKTLAAWTCDLAPGRPLLRRLPLRRPFTSLRLVLLDRDGREIISCHPQALRPAPLPPPAAEPPAPADIPSADELYLTGLHLEQYRHATRSPTLYWEEALRRDPLDARCHHALGRWRLRRGEWSLAEAHLRRAIARLTARNPNPYDGEPHYHLGLVLRYRQRDDDAYAAFAKSAWDAAWRGPASHAMAEIDCARHDWPRALEHLDGALRLNTDHLRARNLKVMVLRLLGRTRDADALLADTLRLDSLDSWARYLAGRWDPKDPQMVLDVALDLARAGQDRSALDLLAAVTPLPGVAPLLHYYQAFLLDRLGDRSAAKRHRASAAQASPDYCFPARLEEILILQAAIDANPRDPRAPYYLGNLFYDRRRHREAIGLWRTAARLDPSFSIVWRNLGIACFNVLHAPRRAAAAYDRALVANPRDARLLYERDQLWKRLGRAPRHRLAALLRHPDLVAQRDDLSIELCALLNQTGQSDKARDLLAARRFQPWEGGEGQVLQQHVRTYLALGRQALARGEAPAARRLFEIALECPENLGEARHLLANQSDAYYWLGEACAAGGDRAAARGYWTRAAEWEGDFQQMAVRPFSEMTYYQALALGRLGRRRKASSLLRGLLAHARRLARSPARIDYFATSLPTMLLFEDDLSHRQTVQALLMQAQAHLGLRRPVTARCLLRQVLAYDPNNAIACDLAVDLQASAVRS